MCSQLAAICHVAFSSVVMGSVAPPNMGKEHDISAWLFSWLNLRHCVGVCYEIMCVRAINTSTLDSSPSFCPCFISNSMTHTGRTADLTRSFPHMTIPGFFGDDGGMQNGTTWTSSFNPEPPPLSSFLLYEGWRVRNQISSAVNKCVRLALHPTYTFSQRVNILHTGNRQSWVLWILSKC